MRDGIRYNAAVLSELIQETRTEAKTVISINYRDGRPIYEQVRDNFRALIISGALPPGYKMPSVRELAATLAINPNTIQRAYRELEAEGCIASVPGKGSFVSLSEGAAKQRAAELKEKLTGVVQELKALGVPEAELIRIVRGGESK